MLWVGLAGIIAIQVYRDIFISVIHIVIQFGRIAIFLGLFTVTICCWNMSEN